MFGFFKKKQTPKDDFYTALLSAFNEMEKADKRTGIERIAYASSAISSLAIAIREVYPNIPIDADGAAMVITTADSTPEGFARRCEAVEYVLQQVRTCPKDKDARIAVMVYFLSPSYFEAQMGMDGSSTS